jgi:hypothetical protein
MVPNTMRATQRVVNNGPIGRRVRALYQVISTAAAAAALIRAGGA